MITNTISVPELLALLIILIGLPISTVSTLAVIGDNMRLRKRVTFKENSAPHMLAKSRIRTEARKCISHLLFLLPTVMLMVQEPRGGNPYNIASVLLVVAILGTLGAMIVDTALYLRERHLIIEKLEKDYAHVPLNKEGSKGA